MNPAECAFNSFKTMFPTIAMDVIETKYNFHTGMLHMTLKDGSEISYDQISRTMMTLKSDERQEDYDLQHEFAKRLDEKLWRRGMTLQQLSEVTGISRQSISRYINGTAMPSLSNLISIARALGCKTSELID